MAKPLKFHQTLNQAPRSAKYGKHRRAGAPAYRDPTDRAGDGAGGAASSGTIWTTFDVTKFNTFAWDFAVPEPDPPAVPSAGIRTGEIIGHRIWWLIDGSLCSLAHKRIWLPDETIVGNTNECVNRHNILFTLKPIWGGTYAFATADLLKADLADELKYMREARSGTAYSLLWGGNPYIEAQALVVGTIKLWGDVVEHTKGYRAEFAKLNSLDGIYGGGDLMALCEKYGVRTLYPQEREP